MPRSRASKNELLNAKLDSAESPDERIALLEEQLKVAKETLEMAESKFSSGRVVQSDVYRAKALYLEIKIKLVRERGKLKPKAKQV
jgi:outer membrane protein TolC